MYSVYSVYSNFVSLALFSPEIQSVREKKLTNSYMQIKLFFKDVIYLFCCKGQLKHLENIFRKRSILPKIWKWRIGGGRSFYMYHYDALHTKIDMWLTLIFVTFYSILVIYCLLLVTFYLLLVTLYSLLVTFYSLLFTLYLLVFTCYSLLFCSILVTFYFLILRNFCYLIGVARMWIVAAIISWIFFNLCYLCWFGRTIFDKLFFLDYF